MEDESSISDPSESSSFHSEHATNVGANLGLAPDCVIETAFEPPDSAKVKNAHMGDFSRCYLFFLDSVDCLAVSIAGRG
jgi:hypothetical protein